MVTVVNPTRAERELFGRILVVLVAEAVGTDQGASFGVTDVLHLTPCLRRGEVSECPREGKG